MKKFFANLLIIITMLAGLTSLSLAKPQAAYADDCGEGSFFGLRAWYHGMCEGGQLKPADVGEDGSGLATWIWKIVLNILFDISVLIGYVAVAMVAWGGYLYMFSRGQPDRAEKGKKTLIAAIVGLLIAVLAGVIMNTISSVLSIS
ncbi:hypothetical protein IKE84_02455 [Candidatus Saccharibacteria bacterium]|nr:hypothetical protein [Candidatus Saccharibacteria bacterium]